jgi:hypothetical protein
MAIPVNDGAGGVVERPASRRGGCQIVAGFQSTSQKHHLIKAGIIS